MKTIHRFIYILALSVAGISASAQDLDPTVVVDRAYEGKLMEVHKPSLEMAVPDSVMRFDLDFDYSVFDNPYKGSYEFNPYLLSMKPSAATDDSGRFFLRAGAGYQLRPEFDMVWSPKMEKSSPFHIDVYARHRSFFGKFHTLALPEIKPADGRYELEDWIASRSGFMNSKAGVDLGFDWEKSRLDMNVGYYGNHRILSGQFSRNYNALDADFFLGSRDMDARSGFIYGIGAKYRRASFKEYFGRKMNENNLDLDLVLGGSLKQAGRVLVDLELDHDGYSGELSGSASVISVRPRYVYERGRLSLNAGLNVSKAIVDTTSHLFVSEAKGQIVYPDVSMRFSLVRNALMFYAKAGGGTRVVSNAELIDRNPFLDVIAYSREDTHRYFGSDMGVEVVRIDATAGLEGRIGPMFSWNLHAGYADYASGLVDCAEVRQMPMEGVSYGPYRMWNVAASWLWKSDRVQVDGNVTYRNAWGKVFDSPSNAFKPAAFVGDVAVEYNFMERIYVGVDCEFSSSRHMPLQSCYLPGYADLGVTAEYITSRAISFWARGGNLLGMTIPRNLIYAFKGPYFTLGISLKL